MLSFIFSQGALDQYDVPEYEYKTFQLSGDDLFSTMTNGDYSETNMNIGANYMSVSQAPGRNCMYGLSFDFTSYSESDADFPDDDIDESNWTMIAPFAFDQYLSDTKGLFGFAEGSFDTFGGDDADGVDDTSDLLLTVGGGFGRVVSARPIAQAYAIADALGVDASDEIILAIATVLGAEASYASIYKDDATQQFYNDLAEAAGSAGSAMQIQKVLTSPAYSISDRYTGWSVKGGLWNNYMRAEGDDNAGAFTLEANYAHPMGMDSQVMVSFVYAMDMNDDDTLVMWESTILNQFFATAGLEDDGYGYGYTINGGGAAMNLGVTYTLDHSYNWSTSADFNYLSETYGVGENEFSDNGMFLTVSTTKAILNQMSVTASLKYIALGGDSFEDSDPITAISTTVTYWVF